MEIIVPNYIHGIVVKIKLVNIPKNCINVIYYHNHHSEIAFRNERSVNKSRVGIGFFSFWLERSEVSVVTCR